MARAQTTQKTDAARREPPPTYRGITLAKLPPSRLPIADIERAVDEAFAKHEAALGSK